MFLNIKKNQKANLFVIECHVLLCDFHREQAWERWLNTVANGMRLHKALVMVFLRRIAASPTHNDYERNVNDFIESDIWQNERSQKMREWFSKTWLPCHKVKLLSFKKKSYNLNPGNLESKQTDLRIPSFFKK